MTTRLQWVQRFLTMAHYPLTTENEVACLAWMLFEGTACRWNPFATTMPSPGATNCNSVGVKNYASEDAGIDATIRTLAANSYGYPRIRAALANGGNAGLVTAAVSASQWGSHPNASHIAAVRNGKYGAGQLGPGGGSGPISSGPAPPASGSGDDIMATLDQVIDSIAGRFPNGKPIRIADSIAHITGQRPNGTEPTILELEATVDALKAEVEAVTATVDQLRTEAEAGGVLLKAIATKLDVPIPAG